MTRIRRVEDRREMEKVVDDFMTQGYKIKNEGQNSTLLKKKTWGSGSGHIVTAVLTVWWTCGLGNVVYAVFKNMTAEEVQVKVDGE